ncbi:OVARIAN TUMOR DOMAIN-containing deubiquitinating enzyme 10 [Cardamine amara subsp. amara]|uniref:OVARIAN TUMOR DOMAIN-containing deubiquitinating enzyme 10 n=1 Tax=Cardamine amara subsp. amara TaxID=228776 RepID=A0ABD0ZYV7_CARAN
MSNTRIKSRCFEDLNDRERLEDSLEWEGYTEIKVKSDGNCQFRALADQLYKNSDFHKRVRQEIVKQLKYHPKFYKGLVDKMEFSEYVKNMSMNSVWGDEVTLKAAADVYGVKIELITSLKHSTNIVILPKSLKEPDKVVYLSYLAGTHFNSLHKNQDSGLSSSLASNTKLQRKKEKGKEEKKKEEEEKKEEKEKEEMKKEKEEKKKGKVMKEKNKNQHFHFSDVMSIHEQEEDDYSFY